MMRAGKLTKTINLFHIRHDIDPAGTPLDHWQLYAAPRAEVIQSTTTEFIRQFGTSSEQAIVFRIRFREDVLLTDTVGHGPLNFKIAEIKEIGRREGLELRCTAASVAPGNTDPPDPDPDPVP